MDHLYLAVRVAFYYGLLDLEEHAKAEAVWKYEKLDYTKIGPQVKGRFAYILSEIRLSPDEVMEMRKKFFTDLPE